MKKSGFADWNTTTFTDGFASRSVISAPNSTIVVGRNMLIGGLLKVIVHQPGWVRSALNCAFACSLPRCVALDWVIHLLLSCEEPYRSDRKPARTSSEKSFGCSQAAKCPPLGSLLKWISLGYARSAQLRGAGKSSSGKTLTAVGTTTPLTPKNE